MYKVFIILAFCSSISHIAHSNISESYSYCVPVEKIDFNPFREIVDGKDLAYLILLKSYISTDENEGGILSKYEFSPDGKVFTGQLTKDLKWSNGQLVTAREAAFGIAKTLQYRTLGKRVKILGTEKLNQVGWSKLSYENINIIDDRIFKLIFESDIENLTGVIREALSTNSRHNRFWPVKLENDDTRTNLEVLFKFSYIAINGLPAMAIDGKKVKFTNAKDCTQSTFSMFPEVFKSIDGLTKIKSSSPSAVIVQPNTNRLNLSERRSLVAWLRSSFTGLPEEHGVQEVDSFFLPGESGFDKKVKWPTSSSIKTFRNRKLVVAVGIPIYKQFIENAAKKSGLKIELISTPFERSDVDATVVASGIIEGRLVFLQDALKWNHVNEFINNAKKTKDSLLIIEKLSASTLPPDLKTLSSFEQNALKEYSLAPVARRYPTAFSKPNLGLCLAWTQRGEMTFLTKGKCISQ